MPQRAVSAETIDPGEAASRLRSPLANPFCQVPTFAVPGLPGEARAILQPDGEPLILIDAHVLQRAAYARFLMAHECCHHSRGHLARLERRMRSRAWRPGPEAVLDFDAAALSHRKIELDADCCAAAQLARHRDLSGIEAGAAAMAAYGNAATGQSYPAGLHARILLRFAASRSRSLHEWSGRQGLTGMKLAMTFSSSDMNFSLSASGTVPTMA
ncbi:MAG: hypothetical protein HC850_18425 [Rhodomicrobium sp.]|nr:hypothetical protein [Rhodomicrobium sp.]